MAHWDMERRAVPAQIDGLNDVEQIDLDRILLACQQAVGDTASAEPWNAAATLLQVQIDGSDHEWLNAIEGALCAARIEDSERHAALFGAFKMARAFLWAHGHADD